MNDIERLVEEHSNLRRLAGELVRLVGPQTGVGWEDTARCDLAAERAAQERFERTLRAHERFEESCIARGCADAPELACWIERNHRDLNGLLLLLRSVSAICDGTHVHSLRTIAQRVNEELEEHLVYEERILFPLLYGRRAVSLPEWSRAPRRPEDL